MKTNKLMTTLVALCSLIAMGLMTGCKKDVKNTLSIDPVEVIFEAEGGTQKVAVTTDATSVEATSNVDWLVASYADKTLTLTARSNATQEARVATVALKAGTASLSLKVSQKVKGDTPTPSNFKPLLKYTENGELAEIPYPFVNFKGGEVEIKAWEAEYGSILTSDPAKKTLIVFTTGDPKGDNPKRMYSLGSKSTLVSCAIAIRATLLFSGKDLNENMLILLQQASYKKMPATDGSILYTNGSYNLAFSHTDGVDYALIMYLPAGNASSGFVASAKDFPLFQKKNVDKYTDEEIKAYETKLGLRPTCTAQGANLTFTTTADTESKTNFYKVVYERAGKNIDIVAYSKSVVNLDMLDQPEKKQWLESNGFTFVKKTSYGDASMYSYTNKEYNFSLIVAAKGTSECFFVFTYTGGGEGPEPEDPNKKREALYLPIYEAFGQPLTETSPVMQMEKDRKFSVKFKAEEEEYGMLYPASIMATPPFDVEYSRYDGTGKAGLSAIVYSRLKSDPEGKISNITISFNDTWKKTKKTDDTDIRAFLEKNGYRFKGSEEIDSFIKGTYYSYYNESKKVLASYFLDKGTRPMPMLTFTQADSYSSAAKARAKQALLLR